MIDFRYHLISIVAVLLALSVGIVVGSGVLGGPLLQDLENRTERIRERNEELLQLAEDRLVQVEESERFAAAAEPLLLEGLLEARTAVIITVEGSLEEPVDELRGAVGAAGGTVSSVITLTERFASMGEIETDLLALALTSTSADPDELRLEAMQRLGNRLGQASAHGEPSRLEPLLSQLVDGEFVRVEAETDADPIGQGAVFFIVAGGDEEPEFEAGANLARLGVAIAGRGQDVAALEPITSRWDIVAYIRGEEEARSAVVTASHAESAAGRVAAILGTVAAADGEAGHYGPDSGSDVVIPVVTPTP